MILMIMVMSLHYTSCNGIPLWATQCSNGSWSHAAQELRLCTKFHSKTTFKKFRFEASRAVQRAIAHRESR